MTVRPASSRRNRARDTDELELQLRAPAESRGRVREAAKTLPTCTANALRAGAPHGLECPARPSTPGRAGGLPHPARPAPASRIEFSPRPAFAKQASSRTRYPARRPRSRHKQPPHPRSNASSASATSNEPSTTPPHESCRQPAPAAAENAGFLRLAACFDRRRSRCRGRAARNQARARGGEKNRAGGARSSRADPTAPPHRAARATLESTLDRLPDRGGAEVRPISSQATRNAFERISGQASPRRTFLLVSRRAHSRKSC